jgi:hypothetical protein
MDKLFLLWGAAAFVAVCVPNVYVQAVGVLLMTLCAVLYVVLNMKECI